MPQFNKHANLEDNKGKLTYSDKYITLSIGLVRRCHVGSSAGSQSLDQAQVWDNFMKSGWVEKYQESNCL